MNGMTPLSAPFEFDENEYYRASRAITKATAWGWIVPLGAVLIPATIIALNVVPHWEELSIATILINSTPWILLAVFYLALIPWQQRRAAKKVQSNNPSARGPQMRVLDETGLRSSGPSFSLDMKWTDFVRAVETPEFFLLFYNKQCAHYLPKRILPPDGIEHARDLIRHHMSGRAKLSSGSGSQTSAV